MHLKCWNLKNKADLELNIRDEATCKAKKKKKKPNLETNLK